MGKATTNNRLVNQKRGRDSLGKQKRGVRRLLESRPSCTDNNN